MITFEGLDENFKFIVIEVVNQIRTTREFMNNPTRELHGKITSRDDYIDNLKTIIENKCYACINADKNLGPRRLNRIRAMQVMSVNLEKIADYVVNIVRQMGYLDDQTFMRRYDLDEIFTIILSGAELIRSSFREEDMPGALAICKTENELDRVFKVNFDRIMQDLGTGKNIQNLVTSLFIFRYFERVGDALLNIGEAIIFSILGERIKIEQFDALQRTLSESGFADSFSDIDFQAIWGTRSGCRIGRVDQRAQSADRPQGAQQPQGSIYKEGSLEKIRKERDNIRRWKSIFPGLVAEIYGFHEEGDKGSLLVEFLPGCTLDEVVLTADREVMENALFIFEQTVRETWLTTLKREPVKTDYMHQLKRRLDAVLQVHPEFRRLPLTMGDSRILSTEELLDRCEEKERTLEAPFSVFIHGDFNINNMVVNHEAQRLHYIDLYRSRDYDYIQDASVFLVSNFRMPLFEPQMRERINLVIGEFYRFVAQFALEQGDETWQARLAFALARSFYTSTRFEMNHAFAKEMFHRSIFLLERIDLHGGDDWRGFRLPTDSLYY
ncbi:MAG: PhoU domain-containing protein [Desulfovibrionaceae bacterium]